MELRLFGSHSSLSSRKGCDGQVLCLPRETAQLQDCGQRPTNPGIDWERGGGGDGGVSTAQPLELHPLGPRVKVDALWLGSLPSLGIS